MAGWVRAYGTIGDLMAMGAADKRLARRAIRRLLEEGYYFPCGIDLETSRIERDVIISEYRYLDPEALDLFVDKGHLPVPSRDDIPVERDAVALFEAVLESRKLALGSSPTR
jgi:hypothetical protein